MEKNGHQGKKERLACAEDLDYPEEAQDEF
jgi:hypothetical protein